jgi:hypothetical protein
MSPLQVLAILQVAAVLVAAALVLSLVRVFRATVVDLLKREIVAWLPHISRRIVRDAALSLPVEQRDILEAWEAELEEYADRPLTMFLLARRIARDRELIATELAAPALEQVGATSGGHARLHGTVRRTMKVLRPAVRPLLLVLDALPLSSILCVAGVLYVYLEFLGILSTGVLGFLEAVALAFLLIAIGISG